MTLVKLKPEAGTELAILMERELELQHRKRGCQWRLKILIASRNRILGHTKKAAWTHHSQI
jgi:hypothetical protein